MIAVFAYGSLTYGPSRRRTIGPDVRPPRKAVVTAAWGHRAGYVVPGGDEVYMGVVPSSPGRRIPGLLLHVTPDQLEALWRREGALYRLVRVPAEYVRPQQPIWIFYPRRVCADGVPTRRYRRLVTLGLR